MHNNLSDPLKKYFQSYGLRPKLRPKLLTVKSSAQNHLIDFENNFHRRNVGQIQVNKLFPRILIMRISIQTKQILYGNS